MTSHIRTLAAVVVAASLTSAAVGAPAHVSADSHGVSVTLKQGVLRLQPMAPDVIRVRYSVDGTFADQRVPVLINPTASVKYTLKSTANTVRVKAGALTAIVDRSTGAVRFADASGRVVVGEVPGERLMTPITLAGPSPVPSYKAVDAFDLPAGESIYGLGQHQDGKLDHRGSEVTLEQVNREVAIPFLVSSKGYGLLWNDAAHTDVSVGAHAEPIPTADLVDDDGQAGGLTGHYFTGENFETETFRRVDPGVDFNWDNTPPSRGAAGLPHDNYSVRWSGTVVAEAAGDYTFRSAADDGVRLYIDGKLVIDDWATHPVTVDTATVHFAAKSRHAIRFEFFQGGGGAAVQLTWSRPTGRSRVVWTSETADDIDYTVFFGPSIDKVLSEYRQATGEAPLIPKWALGYWQSKERYNTQQEWLDIAGEYRRRHDPIDNIVQDWFYWDPFPWGSHKFDPKRYPNPASAIDTLHKDHFHIMVSVWGKFNLGTADNPNTNFDTMSAKGYLYPEAVNSERFYDAFNPGARDLYWRLMRDQIYAKGFDAWWLDASEPEVNMLELRKAKTAAGLGAQVLNGWPLMHTTAVSSGQLRDNPKRRPWILTRSAYAGQQRTGAATWSGDITASWGVLAKQIPAGLNFSLSGIPYWTTDIGAFFVNYPGGADNPEYRELYTRWFEFGAFCPIFRSHGTNTPREMWRFGPETEKTLLKYDKLRYRLMPYIYSQAWQVTKGATLMRALVIDFPNDTAARERQDEFMFGPSMLVCPVIEKGATSRKVYLPAGANWVDFWSSRSYKGGQTIVADAPISKMPIYLRSGSILAMGPDVQYVDEKPADPIQLTVVRGANASFDLYEDDGTSNDYQRGKYSVIPIRWDDKRGVLTIGKRMGEFDGMLKSRTFTVNLIGSGRSTVRYMGKVVAVKE